MKQGFKIVMLWPCQLTDTVILVANHPFINEVWHSSFNRYSDRYRANYTVGMWKIKQLKN